MNIATENEILRGVVGSTAHGTAIEGQDDRDEMGIFIEPPENVCGLEPVDHYIYRDKPDGVRSEAGDLDLTIYSLRKFCRLAVKGNPSILLLLWLPSYIIRTPIGDELIKIRQCFNSKTAGERFLAYLTSQRKRLTGELSKTVSRPDLVAKYGYDTKFAMHALRLGYQGIELMLTNRLTLPVPEPALSVLRAVRNGSYDFDYALQLILESELELQELVNQCECGWEMGEEEKLIVNNFLVMAHKKHWERVKRT